MHSFQLDLPRPWLAEQLGASAKQDGCKMKLYVNCCVYDNLPHRKHQWWALPCKGSALHALSQPSQGWLTGLLTKFDEEAGVLLTKLGQQKPDPIASH